jgi:hypothetical protein
MKNNFPNIALIAFSSQLLSLSQGYPFLNSLILSNTISVNSTVLFDLIGHEANQTFKLLYRATRDGFNASKFHLFCDGRNQTLTLIKTTNFTSSLLSFYIFGGYANIAWSSLAGCNGWSYCSSLYDQDAFIFSLNSPQNLPPFKAKSNEKNSLLMMNQQGLLGPSFGKDIIIVDQSNETDCTTSFGSTYSFNNRYSQTVLCGSTRFRTSEIEVFQSSLDISSLTTPKTTTRVTTSTARTSVSI